MIAANRYHDISCGHRVYGHESKCAHLHGHNYRIHFTVEPEPEDLAFSKALHSPSTGLDHVGRVLDFSVIKSKLCMWVEDNWDHKFLIWKQDPWSDVLWQVDRRGVVIVPFNPTAENMALYLLQQIGPVALKDTGTVLTEVSIEETRKCSAKATK